MIILERFCVRLEKQVRVMDGWIVHGDFVSRNVAITIIFLYVTKTIVVLTMQYTLDGCFTGKTDKKFKALTRITTTPDGLILVSDFEAKQIFFLK